MEYIVSFKYSENVFCTNLVIGTYEAVKKEYSRYPWYSIKESNTWKIKDAKRKGMPIIKL